LGHSVIASLCKTEQNMLPRMAISKQSSVGSSLHRKRSNYNKYYIQSDDTKWYKMHRKENCMNANAVWFRNMCIKCM